ALYTANVASNTSTGIINNAGNWVGNFNNTAGIYNHAIGASLVGNLTNGGTVNAAGGTITGTVTNSNIFNLTGTVTGITTFTNNAGGGTLNFTGTPPLGVASFVNNGRIVAAAATNTLALTGTLSGNGTINTLVNGSNASLVTVGGLSSGTQTFAFTI